jgi:hypothetical protein
MGTLRAKALGSLIVGLMLAAVVVAALMGYNPAGGPSREDQLLVDAREILSQCPTYASDPAYFELISGDCHAAALERASARDGLDVGTQRQGVEPERYFGELYRAMVQRAVADGRTNVGDEIHAVFAAREKKGP